MKYIKYLGLALTSIVLLTVYACNNELDVLEDPRDIPVVYGFLSLTDTTQLIRIERAFVDRNIPAVELAGNADSIYYDESVQVSILNKTTETVHPLRRIDATNIGYVRDEGIFPTSPNILYQIENDELNLEIGTEYELRIERGENLPLVTATTNIVGESRVVRPLASNPVIDFSPIAPTTVRWRSADNAQIHDVVITFNYQERLAGEPFEDRSVDWLMGANINDNPNENIEEHQRDARDFYAFLSTSIPVDPLLTRRVVSLEVTINSGNDQLLEFQRIGQANLSITATQDVPVFTNVFESDTIPLRGLFGSSFRTTLEDVRLSPGSLDSLFDGSLTRDLNFQ